MDPDKDGPDDLPTCRVCGEEIEPDALHCEHCLMADEEARAGLR